MPSFLLYKVYQKVNLVCLERSKQQKYFALV